ncbi:hypothetical protein GUJ93_ZPchr0010g8747 [Zizania palustris]|uniref:Uncharacterized protein n=1 Tax=Zizania palustris TaxID=103762 RepID=A0A8J5WB84_ZIZPA|nr:hypothetical protein GUJ93_ZPchr0010g8747 [Zizania palustris]
MRNEDSEDEHKWRREGSVTLAGSQQPANNVCSDQLIGTSHSNDDYLNCLFSSDSSSSSTDQDPSHYGTDSRSGFITFASSTFGKSSTTSVVYINYFSSLS